MSRTKQKFRKQQGQKRHAPDRNESEAKRQRREAEERWKSTRGDSAENRYTIPLSNKRFNAFYKGLGIISSDKEWDDFLNTLLRPLPACFHMDPEYPFTDALKTQLNDIMGRIKEKNSSDSASSDTSISELPIEVLNWYPKECGFKLGADRRVIRKDTSLGELHKWMVRHTDNGNITRQEAVSMVPPLALNVEPHHKCLDMCAAPGSKTSQLLEIVNRSLKHPEERQGLVVANDADTSRAYMLVHQCRRINSPLLLVTTHQGQQFPILKDVNGDALFDRVLCDVPCSGDGTLRKNPEIWAKWSARNSHSLHPLQLNIASRGLLLLKPGGLMVYSTCSMSPYEDEAVVAHILRQSKGSLELVDPREFVPLFKARPGLSHWPVIDDTVGIQREAEEKRRKKSDPSPSVDEAKTSDSADVAQQDPISSDAGKVDSDEALGMIRYESYDSMPEEARRRVRRSAFPPTKEEAAWMHLERCMRCVPHDEDTGGFFVATFRKIVSVAASSGAESRDENANDISSSDVNDAAIICSNPDEPIPVASNTENEQSSSQRKGDRNNHSNFRGLSEYVNIDEDIFQKIKSFYGLSDALTSSHLYVRKDIPVGKGSASSAPQIGKAVYYIGQSARDTLAADNERRLKVVAAGMKVLERKALANGEVDYRLTQEGIHIMVPFLSDRKVLVPIQDFCNLLGAGLVSYTTLTRETVQALNAQPVGVVVCMYQYDPRDKLVDESGSIGASTSETEKSYERHTLYALCWKGNGRAINVVCNKVEIETIKHQLEFLGVYRPKVGASRPEASATSKDSEDVEAAVDDVQEEAGLNNADASDGEESNDEPALESSKVDDDILEPMED